MAQNLALFDGKSRTSTDSDGQEPKGQVYSEKLKKTLFRSKSKVFTPKKQASKENLGNSVTVARLTLDQLVQVRILVPQVLSQLSSATTEGVWPLNNPVAIDAMVPAWVG